MRAPTLRRGAFFVAGAAWVLHAQAETVEVVATAGATAMRGGFRQLHRTGECTATAGRGQQRRLSEFTAGPLAPNTQGQSRRTATPAAVGSRNGRGSVGPIASARFPWAQRGAACLPQRRPLGVSARVVSNLLPKHGRKISEVTLLGTGHLGAQPAVVAWQGRSRLSVCDWRAGPHGAKAMIHTGRTKTWPLMRLMGI
jgi:hypothetical protein